MLVSLSKIAKRIHQTNFRYLHHNVFPLKNHIENTLIDSFTLGQHLLPEVKEASDQLRNFGFYEMQDNTFNAQDQSTPIMINKNYHDNGIGFHIPFIINLNFKKKHTVSFSAPLSKNHYNKLRNIILPHAIRFHQILYYQEFNGPPPNFLNGQFDGIVLAYPAKSFLSNSCSLLFVFQKGLF